MSETRKSRLKLAGFLDAEIEKGILFLLIFTPLAFGGVQDWSTAVMEIAAFVIFGAWLLKKGIEERTAACNGPAADAAKSGHAETEINTPKNQMFLPVAAVIALVVFQVVPLPPDALALASPSTAALYDRVFGQGAWGWRTLSVFPEATVAELYKLLAYAAVFVVVVSHCRTRERIRRIAGAIIAMGCFLSVFAVVQKLTWNGMLYWIYPVRQGISSSRDYIWGPYINHNHFAGYLEMAIPLAMGLIMYKSSEATSRLSGSFLTRMSRISSHRDFPGMAMLALCIVIMSGALFASLSRGGILGFTAGVLFFIVMMRTRRSLKKKTGIIIAIVIVLTATVVVSSWDRIEDRFGEIGNTWEIKRVHVWHDSLAMARDFPLFGTGFGTFIRAYPRYQNRYANIVFEHAENDYIEILTDLGAAGFAISALWTALFTRRVIRSWLERHNAFSLSMGAGGLAACTALAVHSLTDFNLRIPANALTLCVIAGITYAAVTHAHRESRPDRV